MAKSTLQQWPDARAGGAQRKPTLTGPRGDVIDIPRVLPADRVEPMPTPGRAGRTAPKNLVQGELPLIKPLSSSAPRPELASQVPSAMKKRKKPLKLNTIDRIENPNLRSA